MSKALSFNMSMCYGENVSESFLATDNKLEESVALEKVSNLYQTMAEIANVFGNLKLAKEYQVKSEKMREQTKEAVK